LILEHWELSIRETGLLIFRASLASREILLTV